MTRGEVEVLVAALAEYQKQARAYRNSYNAIEAYKKADDELRRLLWLHGGQLIELAAQATKESE